jgi:hypothetical protein
LQDTLHVRQNIVVPKPQYAVALLPQPAIPRCVPRRLRMLSAIDLDRQLCVQTDEINDETSDRVLAAELRAQLLAAHATPEPALGVGQIAPQLPRVRYDANHRPRRLPPVRWPGAR